jgi:hypothetical protein
MEHRERFLATMRYDHPDRVPYFEEGIRPEVLERWYQQGLPREVDAARIYGADPREEIAPALEPKPALRQWPSTIDQLRQLRRSLDASDRRQLPRAWRQQVQHLRSADTVRMLRVHRGFFLSMGVYDWDRFSELMYLTMDDPHFVRQAMLIWGEFCAAMAERLLQQVHIDAAIFSEPIGGNEGPLISPQMYRELVLPSYTPVLDVLRRRRVNVIIFRTYANARMLIPSILESGFNCLWACEVNVQAMDYRDLRQEFGRDLRLIGGIDLDALRGGRDAIRREVEEKVPPLIADGGYVPLADGRVREDIRYEDYVYYRELVREVIQTQER